MFASALPVARGLFVAVGDRKQIQDLLAKYGSVVAVDVTGKAEN